MFTQEPGQMEQRDGGTQLGQEVEKAAQVVSEGNATILWHHADLDFSSYLALFYVSTALIINFISKSWLHSLEVWLVSVSQTDNTVVKKNTAEKETNAPH